MATPNLVQALHGCYPVQSEANCASAICHFPWFDFAHHRFSIYHVRMPITPQDVQNVAKLARLELPADHLARLTGQLESILEYVAKIGQVDVSQVEPMAHALPLHNVFRDDVVEPSLPLEQVLQNAPDVDGPFFKVPKVIGGDEDSAG